MIKKNFRFLKHYFTFSIYSKNQTKTSLYYLVYILLAVICQEKLYSEFQTHVFTSHYKNFKGNEVLPHFNLLEKLPNWMEQGIQNEFKPFKHYSDQELWNYFINTKSHLIHCSFKNGNLTVTSNRNALAFLDYFGIIFQALKKAKKNVSVNFLVSPLDGYNTTQTKYPILTFSKKNYSSSICIPDWFIVNRRKTVLLEKIRKANKKYHWNTKKNLAFFKGPPNGVTKKIGGIHHPRMQSCIFSNKYPDYCFAKLTAVPRCTELHEIARKLCDYKNMREDYACKYKYLLDLDGHASSYYRSLWILESSSVLLRLKQGHELWYHKGMQPYVHYIPFESDCSDLKEKIDYLRNHDDIAKNIAENGKSFRRTYLTDDMIFSYLLRLIDKCAALNRDGNLNMEKR